MASALVGNWSWTVWLLIPLALFLAALTALAVGPRGDPPAAGRSGRGVGRPLEATAREGESR